MLGGIFRLPVVTALRGSRHSEPFARQLKLKNERTSSVVDVFDRYIAASSPPGLNGSAPRSVLRQPFVRVVALAA